MFERTAQHLSVPFDAVITAQQVGSYKPALKNFQVALARLRTTPRKVLHIAQSIYHELDVSLIDSQPVRRFAHVSEHADMDATIDRYCFGKLHAGGIMIAVYVDVGDPIDHRVGILAPL